MQPTTNQTMPTSLNELDLFISREYGYLNEETDNATWAVYSRLSRVDPNHHGYSLEIQPDRAEEYARSHGATKIEVYSDPDRTGRNSRRMELQRMMKDIRAGRVQIVVVHRLDRLYRNLESLLKFVRFLKRYRVRLVSVTEQIDTDNIMGRFMLVMLGMMAETYVHQTSERTREAKVHRARSGLPNGYIPLGYCDGLCATCNDVHGEGYRPSYGKKDRAESQRGRVAVPHPVTKHAIPLIFDLYLKGLSYREIADWLNSNDITLPDGQTVRFKTKGQTASNPDSLFSRESIRAIMENPFFAGLVARYERPELDKESILAYYLSEEGISAFERENFNLRQSMNRFRNLYQQGDIGLAEYEEQKQFIEQRLKALKPSSRAGAQDALTLLMNLPAELSKITSGEKRLLLDVIFKGLYFDSQGKLRKIMAHPPFNELLGLEEL